MLKTTQDGEKNTQCCTKDMGPNLKKLKTGVFTRTRLNTNSPSSRTTPLAGASSRLGDIPYMEVASTLKNPSTIPIAGASSRSTDIPHMEAAGASTNPSTTPTDGTSSRSSDIPHMEDDGTSTNPCTTPADGAFLQIEDAPHIEQVGSEGPSNMYSFLIFLFSNSFNVLAPILQQIPNLDYVYRVIFRANSDGQKKRKTSVRRTNPKKESPNTNDESNFFLSAVQGNS
ncbi:hypothetical protein ACS0TY_031202 [Phlomoides rotata]